MMKPYTSVSIVQLSGVICLILLTMQQLLLVQSAPSNSSQEQPSSSHNKSSSTEEDVKYWSPFGKNTSRSNNSTEAAGNSQDSKEKLSNSGVFLVTSSNSTEHSSRVRKSLNDSTSTAGATPVVLKATPSLNSTSGNTSSNGSNVVNATHHVSHGRRNSTIRYKPRRRNSLVKKPVNGTTLIHANSTTGNTTTNTSTTAKQVNSLLLNRTRREFDVLILDNPEPPAVLIFEFNTTPRYDDRDSTSNETLNSNSKSKEDEHQFEVSTHHHHHNAQSPSPITLKSFSNSSEEIHATNQDSDLNSSSRPERQRRDALFLEFFRNRNGTVDNNTIPNSDEAVSVDGSQESINGTNNTVLTFTTVFIQVYRIPVRNYSNEENSTELNEHTGQNKNDFDGLSNNNNNFTLDGQDTLIRSKRQVGYGSLSDDSSVSGTGKSSISSGSSTTTTQTDATLTGNSKNAPSSLVAGSTDTSSSSSLSTSDNSGGSKGAPSTSDNSGGSKGASSTSSLTNSGGSTTISQNSTTYSGNTNTTTSTGTSDGSSSIPAGTLSGSNSPSAGSLSPAPTNAVSGVYSSTAPTGGSTATTNNSASSGSSDTSTAPGASGGGSLSNTPAKTSGTSNSASAPSGITSSTTALSGANSGSNTSTGTSNTTTSQNTTTTTTKNSSEPLSITSSNTGPGGLSSSTSSISNSGPSAESLSGNARTDLGGTNDGTKSSTSNTSKTSSSSNGENGKYQFAYEVSDAGVNEYFSEQESQDRNVTRGIYKVLLPDGKTEVVNYTADDSGYHPKVEFEGTVVQVPVPKPATHAVVFVDDAHKNNQENGGK